MRYQYLVKNYRDVEQATFRALRDEISKSKVKSKYISGCKALEVNVFDYVELVIWNDKLTFLDSNGQHYSIWCEVIIEDLIDILNKLN